MGSYAILGATGRVGGQVLQQLLQDENNELHLYVRSKSKILSAQPDLETNPRVSIYEGDLNDTDIIQKCIAGTKACFLAVALSENMPGCSIALDTAKVVVAALERIRTDSSSSTTAQIPRLVVLSSASVTDKYWIDIPWLVHRMIYNANCNIYRDLERAESYLRARGDWIPLTFVKPGGLSDDVARGYKLDTDNCHTPMSFVDLAAGMIEIADSAGETWDLKDVSVVPPTPGQGAGIGFAMPYDLAKGLVACYLPWFYMYLRAWLP